MNSEELGEFFFRQGLDDQGGWTGYVDDDGSTWIPEIASVLDDWTFGQLETILHVRSKRDFAITNCVDATASLWDFQDEQGNFIGGKRLQKPEKQPYGVSAYGAEYLVRDWLKYLGFEDAITTQFRRDEGVDVITEEFDVQVKNWASEFVPVSAIREIYGVAVSRSKKPMFFSHSEYSYDSIDFAEKVSMPLFRFKPETAEIISCNKYAEGILSNQSNHQADIRKLKSWWISYIDAEERARRFLNNLSEVLASSQIEQFEKISTKFRISLDYEKPSFQHDDIECVLLTPEECLEQVGQRFKDLTRMRQASGTSLEDLVLEVECGVFDWRLRESW